MSSLPYIPLDEDFNLSLIHI
ncbi:hypothetical protein ELM60_12420, partial [Klebsiella pneumoniae]|nr:hypothetical protein [Klebsiella pneumoniae]